MRAAWIVTGALLILAGCTPPPETADLTSVRPAIVAPDWASRESVARLTPRPGVNVDALVLKPAGEPIGGVVILTGGDGKLDVASRPRGWLYGNFLVRSRMHFAAEGFVVATMDTPSDQPTGMRGFRLSQDHIADVKAVVARLREETRGPIWLIGTSMGTISATHGALGAGVDGVVLTATITVQSGGYPFSVHSFALEDIRVPVLIFHHWGDGCLYSPWHGTEAVLKRLTRSPKAARIAVIGGDPPRSVPCEAYSAHGFLGIEAPSVALMTDWMKAASR